MRRRRSEDGPRRLVAGRKQSGARIPTDSRRGVECTTRALANKITSASGSPWVCSRARRPGQPTYWRDTAHAVHPIRFARQPESAPPADGRRSQPNRALLRRGPRRAPGARPPGTGGPPPPGGYTGTPSSPALARGRARQGLAVRRDPPHVLHALLRLTANSRPPQWIHNASPLHGPREAASYRCTLDLRGTTGTFHEGAATFTRNPAMERICTHGPVYRWASKSATAA